MSNHQSLMIRLMNRSRHLLVVCLCCRLEILSLLHLLLVNTCNSAQSPPDFWVVVAKRQQRCISVDEQFPPQLPHESALQPIRIVPSFHMKNDDRCADRSRQYARREHAGVCCAVCIHAARYCWGLIRKPVDSWQRHAGWMPVAMCQIWKISFSQWWITVFPSSNLVHALRTTMAAWLWLDLVM